MKHISASFRSVWLTRFVEFNQVSLIFLSTRWVFNYFLYNDSLIFNNFSWWTSFL